MNDEVGKEALREKVELDIEEFLNGGGSITHVESGRSAYSTKDLVNGLRTDMINARRKVNRARKKAAAERRRRRG